LIEGALSKQPTKKIGDTKGHKKQIRCCRSTEQVGHHNVSNQPADAGQQRHGRHGACPLV